MNKLLKHFYINLLAFSLMGSGVHAAFGSIPTHNKNNALQPLFPAFNGSNGLPPNTNMFEDCVIEHFNDSMLSSKKKEEKEEEFTENDLKEAVKIVEKSIKFAENKDMKPQILITDSNKVHVVGYKEGTQLKMSFLGTKGGAKNIPNEWIDVNLRSLYAYYSKQWGIMLHPGFYKRYMEVSSRLKENFIDYLGFLSKRMPLSKMELTVVGHSMGGALAAIFVLEALKEKKIPLYKFNKVQVTLFGLPTCLFHNLASIDKFNKIISNNKNIELYTIINYGDPVVSIYANGLGDVGKPLYLGKKSKKPEPYCHWIECYKKEIYLLFPEQEKEKNVSNAVEEKPSYIDELLHNGSFGNLPSTGQIARQIPIQIVQKAIQ